MDDATTFAALAALPARFQWCTERRSLPHADRSHHSTTLVLWEIMITLDDPDDYDFRLRGEGATLAAAYADLRAQLVAFGEIL